MRRIPLESSTLASVLYLPKSRELEVEFRSGQIYRYRNVPPHSYHELMAARSKGAYYNFNIRNHFSFQQLGQSLSAKTGAV
jgi:hypothetical protein